MELLVVSFIAGLLTILAPCILPLLPIIIGGSVEDSKSKVRPVIITASLAASIFIFTLLLRASTALIDVPVEFWRTISGGIIVIIGLLLLFPGIWERFSNKTKINTASNKLLGKSIQKGGVLEPILIGAALGPVFTSCSPTYAIVVATVLPESFARGIIYLLAYVAGLALVMLVIALAGQKLINKLNWATDPRGWFKRTLGAIFILVGLAVFTGFDKTIETWLLDNGFFDRISEFEQNLLGD